MKCVLDHSVIGRDLKPHDIITSDHVLARQNKKPWSLM